MSFLPEMKMNSIVKNFAHLNVLGNDLEKAIFFATSNDREVPDSEQVNMIAEATHDSQNYTIVMKKIWDRIVQKPKDWKIVYKVLNLIEAILRSGAARCIDEVRSNEHVIKGLLNFDYTNTHQIDCGVNVREKAKDLLDKLSSDDILRDMRADARRLKERITQGVGNSIEPGAAPTKKYNSSSTSSTFENYQRDDESQSKRSVDSGFSEASVPKKQPKKAKPQPQEQPEQQAEQQFGGAPVPAPAPASAAAPGPQFFSSNPAPAPVPAPAPAAAPGPQFFQFGGAPAPAPAPAPGMPQYNPYATFSSNPASAPAPAPGMQQYNPYATFSNNPASAPAPAPGMPQYNPYATFNNNPAPVPAPAPATAPVPQYDPYAAFNSNPAPAPAQAPQGQFNNDFFSSFGSSAQPAPQPQQGGADFFSSFGSSGAAQPAAPPQQDAPQPAAQPQQAAFTAFMDSSAVPTSAAPQQAPQTSLFDETPAQQQPAAASFDPTTLFNLDDITQTGTEVKQVRGAAITVGGGDPFATGAPPQNQGFGYGAPPPQVQGSFW